MFSESLTHETYFATIVMYLFVFLKQPPLFLLHCGKKTKNKKTRLLPDLKILQNLQNVIQY